MLKKLVPLAVLACLVGGCGDDAASDDEKTAESTRSGDAGSYYLEQVGALYAENSSLPGMPPGPANLASMLPCGTDLHPNAVDEVVVGEVTEAVEGEATVMGDEAEVPIVLDDWSDESADARDVLITVSGSVLSASGRGAEDETMTMRVTVPEPADPQRFLESAGNLGPVVVFTSPRPADPHQGEPFPALNGALVGLVDNGEVSFPALPDGFAGDYTTTEAILDACPVE